MDTFDNRRIIETAVADFVAGDLEAVLGILAEDVDFRPSGPTALLPWAEARRGRDGVRRYFEDLLTRVEYELFEAERYLADGDLVVVLGRARMRFRDTGRVVETDWVLRFRLAAGYVVEYRDSWDTAAGAVALHGEGLAGREGWAESTRGLGTDTWRAEGGAQAAIDEERDSRD